MLLFKPRRYRGLKPLQPGYVDQTNIKTWMLMKSWNHLQHVQSNVMSSKMSEKTSLDVTKAIEHKKSAFSVSLWCCWERHPSFRSWDALALPTFCWKHASPQNLRPLLLKHGNSIYSGPQKMASVMLIEWRPRLLQFQSLRRDDVECHGKSWKVSLGEKNKKGSLPVRRRQLKHILIWKWSSWNTCNRNMKHQPPRLSCCVLDATRQSSSQDVEIILTKHWVGNLLLGPVFVQKRWWLLKAVNTSAT